MAGRSLSSMTGFGRAEHSSGRAKAVVEARSLNQRFLRVSVKLPPSSKWRIGGGLEAELRRMVSKVVARGTVDMFVDVESAGEGSLLPDEDLVLEYVAAWRKIARRLGLPGEVSVGVLASMPELFASRGPDKPRAADVRGAVVRAAGVALGRVLEMRRAEGGRLAKVIKTRLGALEKLARRMGAEARKAKRLAVERLKERVFSLLPKLQQRGPVVELSEGALAREVALSAERLDVSEEIERIESHLAQFRTALSGRGPVGRRLEFLVQELSREINTLSSKVGDGVSGGLAVDFKTELEKTSEQVQNIE